MKRPTGSRKTVAPLPLDAVLPGHRLEVVLARNGETLVEELALALSLGRRLRGLMLRPALRPGQGMLLMPCNGVHTLLMRAPIDVLFLDEAGEVLALYPALPPWRATRLVAGAVAALELSPGAAEQAGLARGDRLLLLPAGL